MLRAGTGERHIALGLPSEAVDLASQEDARDRTEQRAVRVPYNPRAIKLRGFESGHSSCV